MFYDVFTITSDLLNFRIRVSIENQFRELGIAGAATIWNKKYIQHLYKVYRLPHTTYRMQHIDIVYHISHIANAGITLPEVDQRWIPKYTLNKEIQK